MPNIFRSVFSSISRKLASGLTSSRRVVEVPIKITMEPDRNTGRLSLTTEALSIVGTTRDVSLTGLGFCVDSIRLREHYLVGEEKIPSAEIDLPNGRVKMRIVGQRYEEIGKQLSITKFLIGATIVEISELDRAAYEEFLRFGNKVPKAKPARLGLEINNS